MVTVPFTPFEPDKSRYNVGAIPTAINVVPLPDGGYGPLPSTINTTPQFEYITDNAGNRLTDNAGNRLITGPGGAGILGAIQLPGDCVGMYSQRRSDGSEALFAATTTSIYKFNRTTFVFEDVSGATYTGTERWSPTNFGSIVLMQNGADAEQMYDVESASVFSSNSTAPIAKYIATVSGLVFRGNIVSWASQGITNAPAMIQCSALENPMDNEPQNDNWSDYQSIPTGDEVMGIVPVSGGAHIPMRNAMYGMALTLGGQYTFTLAPINMMRGTSSPRSICIIGQDDYIIYCDDGFWRFTGGQFQPIGNGRVNLWFLDECDQNERENIISNLDPEHNIVWIAYTATDGTRKMLGYHYIQDQWVQSDLGIQASCVSRTFAYSGESGAIVDGDLKRFAVIDTARTLGYLVGENRAARLTTNEYQPGVRRSFVNGAYLNGDALTFTITHYTRDTPAGTQRARAAASPSSRSAFTPFRADGLKHQDQVDIEAATIWSVASGLEVNVNNSGRA